MGAESVPKIFTLHSKIRKIFKNALREDFSCLAHFKPEDLS